MPVKKGSLVPLFQEASKEGEGFKCKVMSYSPSFCFLWEKETAFPEYLVFPFCAPKQRQNKTNSIFVGQQKSHRRPPRRMNNALTIDEHLRQLDLQELLQNIRRCSPKELKLTSYNLHDIPAEVLTSTKLHSLDLSRNRLGALTYQLTKLENLNALYLNENELQALPAEIFDRLNNLEILEVSQNMIREIPVRYLKTSSFLDLLLHQ